MPLPLVPLRIPAGWAVVFNIFVETADVAALSPADRDGYLSADLLSIEQLRFAGGRWETDRDGVLVDLGWSTPGDPAGEYVLTVLLGGWHGPQATLRSRSADRIRRALDTAFAELADGRPVTDLGAAWDRSA